MGKRSPELLTSASRPFSVTTRRGAPVKGLRNRDAVSGFSAQESCLSGRNAAQMAKATAATTHVRAKADAGSGRPVAESRKSFKPSATAKSRAQRLVPTATLERSNSWFHIQTTTAANQKTRNVWIPLPDAAPVCKDGWIRAWLITAARGRGSVESNPGKRGLVRR